MAVARSATLVRSITSAEEWQGCLEAVLSRPSQPVSPERIEYLEHTLLRVLGGEMPKTRDIEDAVACYADGDEGLHAGPSARVREALVESLEDAIRLLHELEVRMGELTTDIIWLGDHPQIQARARCLIGIVRQRLSW